MKPSLALFAALCVACVPASNGVGDLTETGSGSGSASGSGSGSATSASATSATSASGTTTTATATATATGTATQTGTDTATDTGPDAPQACIDAGWWDSLLAWNDAVEAQGDTYYYTANTNSYLKSFAPSCIYETLIEVADGAVVGRRFRLLEAVDVDPSECEPDFFEDAGSLGSNDVPAAGAVLNFDELYQACCNESLVMDPMEYNIEFETDKAGLMSQCGSVMMNCADGCADGPAGYEFLRVEQVTFGSPPE